MWHLIWYAWLSAVIQLSKETLNVAVIERHVSCEALEFCLYIWSRRHLAIFCMHDGSITQSAARHPKHRGASLASVLKYE